MADKTALFESLHREYRAMVLQLCLGFMKGDHEVAKDLSQQVFINIWQALEKFRHASAYKTWIYRVSVNTCLKYIRDRKDNLKVPIDEVVSVTVDDTSQVSALRSQSLYQAIGKLAEVDRLIIMMILDELEYQEISAVVGISEVNLRVKIHRIKKQLKKILEDERQHR